MNARLIKHNGYPAIELDGKVYPPMMATIRTSNHKELVLDEEYFKNLGQSGIKIYFLICDTEWTRPGAFEMFKQEADMLFKNVPDAYIFLRIGVHPPVSWCEENPDELVKYSDGSIKPAVLWTESLARKFPGMYSLCSSKWREDAGKALLDIAEKIESLPYADRIAGYFIAAGGTSEWYYINPLEYGPKVQYLDSGGFEQTRERPEIPVYGDVSPAFRRFFSDFLKREYKTVENLRAAWGEPDVDFDNFKIPDCEERYVSYKVDYDLSHPANQYRPELPDNGTNRGCFLDISKYRRVFDFYRAVHIGVAESIIHFGRVIKDKYPERLIGSFYGASGSTKFFDFGTAGGVRRILESDAVDFLASPGVYENRQPGGFIGQRQAHDSYRLYGKMFIVEEDARTHLDGEAVRNSYELFDVENSIHTLKRDFGRNVCMDLQAWWFDQPVGGGRYRHEKIYELFKAQEKIAHEAYSKDRTLLNEIAFIYDEESLQLVSNETSHQMVELFRNYEIDIIGVPSARYYHNDIDKIPDYKLYVFVNCFYLTDEERRKIKEKLKKNHATALFLYGNGFVNPDRTDAMLSVENIKDLTGISVEEVNAIRLAKFKISGEGLTSSLDRGEIYGDFVRKMWANSSDYPNRIKDSRVYLYPAFYANDEDAKTLGSFCDCGRPALSVKECDGYTSVLCGSKYISADVVRAVAEMAGCHIYNKDGDVLYANRSYVTLHAAKTGKKTVYLPEKYDVTEVYENKLYAKNSDKVEFELLKGQTVMFRLTKPEK